MILLNGGVRTFIQVFAIKLIQEVIVDVYRTFDLKCPLLEFRLFLRSAVPPADGSMLEIVARNYV